MINSMAWSGEMRLMIICYVIVHHWRWMGWLLIVWRTNWILVRWMVCLLWIIATAR